MYLYLPKRMYNNRKTNVTSHNLADVIGETATVKKDFNVGVRRGSWPQSPFGEVQTLTPQTPPELQNFEPAYPDGLTYEEAVPKLFAAVCNTIENVWQPDKFHVHFSSAGYDSRIISGAIRALVHKNGDGWLGRGMLFLSNRWEGLEFREMMQRQGWQPEHYAVYEEGSVDQHFDRCLDFKRFWRETNAPTPLGGNLWWYLPDWAQERGLIPSSDDECQGFAGYWANETWNWFARGGPDAWMKELRKRYHLHVMATLPFKLPMEFPLSSLEVLRIIPSIKNGSGDKLRKAVSEFASPETAGLRNPATHDRKRPISQEAQDRCWNAYRGSWYAKNVERGRPTLSTSGFSNDWGRWGLASLCEHLVKERGVQIGL